MDSWPDVAVGATADALLPLRDEIRAGPMATYMKNVAPFLGIASPARRQALRDAWRDLPAPGSDDLGAAAGALMALPEREFHYAAYDLITRYRTQADASFLRGHVTDLLTMKPWWDTVDGFVSAAVSPLSRRFDSRDLIDEWSESGDMWLIRAAITHQRGWKGSTEVTRVLELCDRHWADSEFFVAKAVGWALRDLTRLDPEAVRDFLEQRSSRNAVAEREARRGLARSR